ncbi:MAG: NIPSNAP family protein [Alphaproteobacteria bacterium]
MIVEMRTYTLHPGTVPLFLKSYQEEGMAIQLPVLGHMVGYYFTEVGPLNQIVHMWGYDSFEERMRRRGLLAQSAPWQAYLKKVSGYLMTQENKLLNPAPWMGAIPKITPKI